MSVHFPMTAFAVIFNLCIFLRFSDCQTTPFDPYAEVSVPNQTPSIPNETEKTYTTTVKLEKIDSNVQFVDATFTNAARGFYSELQGFIQVDNVRSTELANNVVQVTYDVRYSYPVLEGFVNGDDSEIQSKIGNFEAVKTGLNEQPNILGFYSVLDDNTAFSFGGSSVCAFASCEGTYVSCIETTGGINTTCVSDCKAGYCGDNGLCSHTDANEAPTCRCTSLPDLWIIGERCETKFPLWLVVLLAVIGFLIILIVLIIAVICVIRRRKEKRRKQDLLNSVPKTYQNNGFVNDEDRNARIGPETTIVPTRINPVSSLARDDSFETVTSAEAPPSEYRPRSVANRRSYASSDQRSTQDRRRHHHHHYHRHRHHRRHSDSSGSPPSRRETSDERARSTERDHHQQRSPTPSTHSSEDRKDKNLSYYEIEVNDLDLDTEAASSVVASSTKSSPIRWLPPKDASARPGWVPSLGPLMYDLPESKKTNTESETLRRQRNGGTDV